MLLQLSQLGHFLVHIHHGKDEHHKLAKVASKASGVSMVIYFTRCSGIYYKIRIGCGGESYFIDNSPWS
jgi:hypothetical protein